MHAGTRVLARGLVAERGGGAARGAPELGLGLQVGQRVARVVDVAREDHLIWRGRQSAGLECEWPLHTRDLPEP